MVRESRSLTFFILRFSCSAFSRVFVNGPIKYSELRVYYIYGNDDNIREKERERERERGGRLLTVQ